MISLRVKDIRIRSERIARRVKAKIGDPLTAAANDVEREAKASMVEGGRRAGRKSGVASPPGMPPHRQTGDLAASVTHAKAGPMSAIAGPTNEAWYGKIHEFGGEYGGRNYPERPFMRPALQRTQRKMIRHFRMFLT